MIAFACARCGQKLQIPDQYAGKPVRCSVCKHVMTSPAPVAVAAAAKAPLPELSGQPSSLAQAGLGGGVTLGMADSGANDQTVKDKSLRRSLRDVLARGPERGQRYQVLNELARGGMGAVLRAADCDIRREVAVKYLLDQADPRKKARFVEEAQITGQLEHPNIVPIHELGIDADRRLFFAMKMVRGRSLQQVLTELRDYPRTAEKEYTLVRLLNILINMCHALAYAHARGVVHRDLKPANIMLGDFGEVYVMDWGLAKVLPQNNGGKTSGLIQSAPSFAWAEGQAAGSATTVHTSRGSAGDQTIEGTVMGTPLYMPPEQALGDIAAIDQRSDIYSLGAILYEILTLQPPVSREGGQMAILTRVSKGEIIPPVERDPKRAKAGKIPKELAAIALKALAKNPADRYPSAEELRRDIERFLEGRSVSAKEDTKWEALWKFTQRNKAFSASAAAAVLLLAIVIVSSWWMNYKARVRAESNYAAYLKEQQAKKDQAKNSVPAFVEAAYLAVEQKRLDDALAQVTVALEYDPDHAGARLLKGQLLIARKEFAEAARELEQYLKAQPNDTLSAKLTKLCVGGKAEDPAVFNEMVDILIKQHRAALVEGMVQAPEKLLAVHRQKVEKAWPGLGDHLTLDGTGALALNLTNCPQVLDLKPLQGMPLHSLSIQHGKIADLTPLKGMPLVYLDLLDCPRITDLAPLKGMKLTTFYLTGGTVVSDVSVLRSMPLARLQLQGPLKNRDFRAFRDMPLTDLALQNTEITDLTPLKGKKLTSLSIQGSGPLEDLQVLQGMPLVSLSLNQCGPLPDLKPLRGLPLTTLTLANAAELRDLTPLQGMRLTNLNLTNCPQVKDLSPIQGMPLVSLGLNGLRQLKDLPALRGMPLTNLDVSNCPQISDWTALRNLPLITLGLANDEQFTDLSLLQGMSLTSLSLDNCRQIKDLTPLKGMQLIALRIPGCDQVTDLTPLAGMKLTYLHFQPRSIKTGIEILRAMKTLVTINDLPAEDFWKKYDAGQYK